MMEEQIRVSLTLPAAALDGLSALAEQLRLLTAAVGALPRPASPVQPEETEESGFFDPERFRQWRERSEQAAPPVLGQIPAARSVPPPEPPAQADRQAPSAESPAAPPPPKEAREAPAPSAPDAPAPEPSGLSLPDALSARPEQIPGGPDAPSLRPQPEASPPHPAPVRTPAEERTLPLSAVHGEVSRRLEPPPPPAPAASAPPEPPTSRWASIPEPSAPALSPPLTAEDVSLAFQRDGRRYDGGFPLY